METLIDNSINYACTTWASLIDVFQYWIPSIRRLLLVISAKTKSYQKNQMLCSRKSHKLDQVLFLRNQLLQLIARTISILRRAILPEFLRISRNCTCKDCALFYHTYIYIYIYVYIYIYIYILHVILHIRSITLAFAICVINRMIGRILLSSFSFYPKFFCFVIIINNSQKWSTIST